jgi:Ser/Thr protein kinase RdoA (MazF antagonist)
LHHHGSTLTAVEVIIGVKGADESRGRFIVKRYAEIAAWNQARRAAAFLQSVRSAGFSEGASRVPAVHEIDDSRQVIIEEGQRGRRLFDILSAVGPAAARDAFERAARWLAHFHAAKIPPSSVSATREAELARIDRYTAAIASSPGEGSRIVAHAARIYKERISALLSTDRIQLVEAHGDYHPKNIIAGRDLSHDENTEYISVIDFASVKHMPREFDIGYFAAQMTSMFHDRPDVTDACTPAVFVNAYQAAAGAEIVLDPTLLALFELRGMLSIANYLYRLGLGTSELFVHICARSASLSDQLRLE